MVADYDQVEFVSFKKTIGKDVKQALICDTQFQVKFQ
jgi:hypothetical protein